MVSHAFSQIISFHEEEEGKKLKWYKTFSYFLSRLPAWTVITSKVKPPSRSPEN